MLRTWEAVIERSVDGLLHERMPQGPLVLVAGIFGYFCIVAIERFLKARQRRLAFDFGFCFLKDFQAKGGFEELGNRHLKDQKEAFRKLGYPFYF